MTSKHQDVGLHTTLPWKKSACLFGHLHSTEEETWRQGAVCHRQVIVCTHRSVSIKTLTEKVQSVCHSYNFQRTKAYHRHHKHLENSSSPSFLLFPIFLLQVTNKYSARKSKRNSFLVFAVGFVLFGILAIAQYLISNVCHNQCTLLLCFGCILELSLQCKGNLNRKAAVSMIGPEDVCLKFFYIWDNHEHFFFVGI